MCALSEPRAEYVPAGFLPGRVVSVSRYVFRGPLYCMYDMSDVCAWVRPDWGDPPSRVMSDEGFRPLYLGGWFS